MKYRMNDIVGVLLFNSRIFMVFGLVLLPVTLIAGETASTQPGEPNLIAADLPLERPAANRNWGVQFGVAAISQNNIGEVLTGTFDDAEDGMGGGWAYTLTGTYVAHRFEIPSRWGVLRPQFEPYVALTLVDESGRGVFPDYNAGIGFRWVDFPWNRWVKTSFFTGVGLTYSSEIWMVDRVRHPGEDRSNLKIDWPIQLFLAHPHYPQHQVFLYIDHQSGGHIFDEGGVNTVGVGYRLEF